MDTCGKRQWEKHKGGADAGREGISSDGKGEKPWVESRTELVTADRQVGSELSVASAPEAVSLSLGPRICKMRVGVAALPGSV